MKICKIVLAVLAASSISGALHAEGLEGTLKKVKDNGVITVGVRESSIPFSYYDNEKKSIGYSYDIMMKIVDAVKKNLKLSKLDVKNIPITSQNRIALINNGTIDIECGSTTNSVSRQKQVDFSNTIFVIGTRLLTNKNSGIKDFADLQGKNVVTTAGTTSERLLRKMNDEKKMGMNIISAKDHGEGFTVLETGKAAAFMMDDALLAGERAKSKDAKEWIIVGAPQSKESYGCMIRKNDPSFKKLVDAAVAETEKSGEATKLYAKWFQSPIPPKGLNLNFPLSEDMKALFKEPNDKALSE